LTDPVRKRRRVVVLLDEIEKAHPDVLNVLLQVFDDGRLTDGEGRTVDFRSTLIIMTTNAGTAHVEKNPFGFTNTVDKDEESQAAVQAFLSPELMNRLDAIIDFHKLTKADLYEIIELLLSGLQDLLTPRNIKLVMTTPAKDLLVLHGTDEKNGARPLKRSIHNLLKQPLADLLIEGKITSGMVVDVGAEGDALVFTPRVPTTEVLVESLVSL
jgi:ATP-dependent Clp protease ATP-binding subunit ClpA